MKIVSATYIIAKPYEFKKCFKCDRIHYHDRKKCKWCEHDNFVELNEDDFERLNDLRGNLGIYTMEVW